MNATSTDGISQFRPPPGLGEQRAARDGQAAGVNRGRADAGD